MEGLDAMPTAKTQYAKSGDVRIAYQVVGQGPLDLVWVPGFISNLDHNWNEPGWVHFQSRLAAFSRLIMFDKRGTGLSDRLGSAPTLEQRMDDVRAVMDAVGSHRAALFGISDGGPMSLLFAATYPDRTQALVLFGTYANSSARGLPPETPEALAERLDRHWGTGESLRDFAPSRVSDEGFRSWWAAFERLGASPSAVIALLQMNGAIDVRHVLPSIHVPTLVMHRAEDCRMSVEAGRYLGAHIANAKYVELPGVDHVLWVGDTDRVADEMEEFLTGSRSAFEPDRVLATVLFTDIVDSTKKAAELGDYGWRILLDRHDAAVRREIVRFRGREVKTLGDGFLATFDGPARAVRCASGITQAVHPLGIAIRSGLHTGEIEIKGEDVGGIAVHIAARVAALAGADEVVVSSTVRDLVAGSGLRFREMGSRALKGLSEELRLFCVDTGSGDGR
jgi:pimeloyl-ACP methyl ester carboxylesterase